ncbi:MAG: CinA family nicotinamide mononucleotide deamidase-related protein [Holophagales bacterium]|nr:CinA family nicotinamide mononucleotide deamidase-related protein [Holophagales bacterium]
MRGAILAIGSELLGRHKLDTNSLYLTGVLERHGVMLEGKSVVGDDEHAIAREIGHRLEEVEILVLTGGLGPTADDRTRVAAAQALGRSIAVDEAIVEHIRKLFRSFGRDMPEVNRRQAEVVEGAEVLHNRKGSAPGQRLAHRRGDGVEVQIFLLPGVPREVSAMVEDHLEPWLVAHAGDVASRIRERRVLKVASLPESEVEERIAPAYERFGRDAIAVLASPGEIRVESVARGPEAERRAQLDAMTEVLRGALGDAVFTGRADEDLEQAVGRALEAAGRKLVTAESCTGGLVSERLTRIPGSSAWFLGGAVAYSYGMKTRLLGVPQTLIQAHGAVSEEVARAMAEGALERLGGDLAISITGIAGPGGATPEKPVGLVHLALSSHADGTRHRVARFPGGRERVRRLTSQVALDWVRRYVLGIA